MAGNKIRVLLIYRNYKPLHSIYQSLINSPPDNVEYIYPAPRTKLKKLFKWYKRVNSLPLLRNLVYVAENKFFLQKAINTDADIYHYVNMIGSTIPDKPYVIDIEHATGLISFSTDRKRIAKAIQFLEHDNCKSINCMSQAAERSLKNLLGKDYKLIAAKTQVIYPAMPFIDPKLYRVGRQYISKRTNSLDLLFVGNLAYLKGIEELLYAIKQLNSKYHDQLRLFVVSVDAQQAVEKYGLDNVYLYPPKFSHVEMIENFYLPASLFVAPTKSDTFGMAVLDSLTAGTPVIASKLFAIRELVSEGVDGILLDVGTALLDAKPMPAKKDFDAIIRPNFNAKTADKLVATLTKVLEGQVDLHKLGINAKKKFQPGQKFATDTRNQKLLSTYQRALKS